MSYSQGQIQAFVLDAAIPSVYVTSLVKQAEELGITQDQLRQAIGSLRDAEWLTSRGNYYLITLRGIDRKHLLHDWKEVVRPFNAPEIRLDEAFIRDGAIHLQFEDCEGAAIAILSPGCPLFSIPEGYRAVTINGCNYLLHFSELPYRPPEHPMGVDETEEAE